MTPSDQDLIAHLSAENAALRAALAAKDQDEDGETGLPGPARFAEALDRSLAQANRHGTPAALLHVVVAQRAQLAEIAGILSGLIRSGDFLARTGEISFGLILSHLDHNSAIETAERLAQCVGADRVAIGIAPVLGGDATDEIVQRAARNLEASRAG